MGEMIHRSKVTSDVKLSHLTGNENKCGSLARYDPQSFTCFMHPCLIGEFIRCGITSSGLRLGCFLLVLFLFGLCVYMFGYIYICMFVLVSLCVSKCSLPQAVANECLLVRTLNVLVSFVF